MIPIYRAKRNDSNKYIEGLLSKSIIGGNEAYFIESWEKHRIDISTLAIHFPDMLDSNGNKIFASLREDGKGGDIISLEHIRKTVIWCKKTQAIMLNSKSTGLSILSLYKEDIEVIGIQE